MPDLLPAFQIGAPLRADAVTVFPVFAALPRVDYRLAVDAFADGSFEIHEATHTAGRPMVGMLEARNRGGRRVLIIEGDHLVGAKQNRMLTSSALIGGAQCLPLPASCVEQGRWQGPTEQFARSATMAPASLRRIAKLSVTRSVLSNGGRRADQQRIWSTIADQQRRLAVSSATCSLAHTFAERAPEVGRATARLGYIDGAIGIAIGLANELISIDAFDSPASCAHYWRRLVEGAALEGLAARRANDDHVLAPSDVEVLLARAGVGAWRAVEPVGDGEEHRANLDGDVGAAASLLRLDGRLVHFGVVTGTVAPVHSQREHPRMMRRYLPDELARRYCIVDRIGVGGSKEVFRANVLAGGPDVAIARMPYVDDIQFDGELDAIRRVDSAYVPRIYESLIDEHGDGYIVMERCDGPNLATIVGPGALPLAEAAPIMVAFARGLREIHEAHVLHRDVKLDNAMLSTANDQVELKIVDFGLSARSRASATDVGVVRFGGTLPYMSREMLRGQPLDARSDVYAFGVCCFRMLVGEFPIPPTDHESDFDYMRRLSQLSHHDFTALPHLPSPARSMLIRMLDLDREHRPLMPEVVAAFERAFGNPPLHIAQRTQPIKRRTPRPALVCTAAAYTPIESPEHVLVTADMQSPIVVLLPLGTHPTSGSATAVTGYNARGQSSWAHELPGSYAAGLRADLDGDGMREIYLAGPDSVALLGASGRVKYTRSVPAYAARPTLIAIGDRDRPRLVIDGHLIEPATGGDLGMLPYTYQGDGSALVDTDDRRGIAYNGFALQAFRGWHGTAPAIINHARTDSFLVAHLEESRSATPRVQLAIYGPGGGMRHMLHVADGQLATGDTAEIARLRNAPLFPASCSPLALLSADGRAVAIVPLLGADRALPALLAAFELPTGRLLWRTELPGVTDGRAILADVDGDGHPELVVGDGTSITAYDPWTGTASEPIACRGVPIAFGDPFASGFNHLFVVVAGGVEMWRGATATAPGTMQWCGARGDLWRTGTLGANGKPLGPL